MPTLPTLQELMTAGVHFGHSASKWYPKMAPFIFGVKGGVHVMDLEKTQVSLQKAIEAIKEVVSSGGQIIFVGTKKQSKDIVKKYAEECHMPYVTNRWLGGTLTNYGIIKKQIERLAQIKADQASGGLDKYTKKERLGFEEEKKRLESLFGGLATLKGLPKMIFVVDIRHEETVMREAKQLGIPVVAIVDSNVDPTEVDYPIPGNDDSVKSVDLITKVLAEACREATQS